MRIGIYNIGSIEEHRQLGALAVRVAKHTMPGVEVWHLTDETTPAIDGAIVSRMARDCPMAVLRMRHHQASGDWLFIDTDVLVLKDVAHVFDEDFDIAIASRVAGDGAHGPAWVEMPHNMGVVFSRSPEFWGEVEDELETYEPRLQQWMGDQLAVCRMIKRGAVDAKIIPGEVYNFPPRSPAVGDAAIAHYKGKRKPWMIAKAQKILEDQCSPA